MAHGKNEGVELRKTLENIAWGIERGSLTQVRIGMATEDGLAEITIHLDKREDRQSVLAVLKELLGRVR